MNEVLGREQQFSHCGIVFDIGNGEELFHATLDGTTIEPYSEKWLRATRKSVDCSWCETEVLHSILIVLHLKYRITYLDWLKMLFNRPAKSCAHVIALVMNMNLLNSDATITPDLLFDHLTK